MGDTELFSVEAIDAIKNIIRRGNTAEIKKENNKIVVIEIQRKVKTKTSIIG